MFDATRRGALAALGAAALAPSAALGQAAAYPSRPIKMLVPFPPGGPTDLVARVIADAMTADLRPRPGR